MADLILRAPPRDGPLLEAPRRRGRESRFRAPRLPIGGLTYLAALGIVAAATTAAFFGSGFFLLMHTPGETDGGVAPRRPMSIPTRVDPPPPVGIKGELAAAPPTTPATPQIARPPKPPVTVQRYPSQASTEPTPATKPAPPQLATKPAPLTLPKPAPAALTEPGSLTTPKPDLAATPPPPPPSRSVAAAEIAHFLARGDALFHEGDAASARFFYRQAVDAGDHEAALRLGMTFDPVFAKHRSRRKWRPNPDAARFWYRRALALGAAGAQRQLDQFELNQLVRKSSR